MNPLSPGLPPLTSPPSSPNPSLTDTITKVSTGVSGLAAAQGNESHHEVRVKNALQAANMPPDFINALQIRYHAQRNQLTIQLKQASADPAHQSLLDALRQVSHEVCGTPLTAPTWTITPHQLQAISGYFQRDTTKELAHFNAMFHHILGDNAVTSVTTPTCLAHVAITLNGCPEKDRPFLAVWLGKLTQPPLSFDETNASIISASQIHRISQMTNLWMGIKSALISQHGLPEDADLATIWEAIVPSPIPIHEPGIVIQKLIDTVIGTSVASTKNAEDTLRLYLSTQSKKLSLPPRGPITEVLNPHYLPAAMRALTQLKSAIQPTIDDVREGRTRPELIDRYYPIVTCMETLDHYLEGAPTDTEKVKRLHELFQIISYAGCILMTDSIAQTVPDYCDPDLHVMWDNLRDIFSKKDASTQHIRALLRQLSAVSSTHLPYGLYRQVSLMPLNIHQLVWHQLSNKVMAQLPPQHMAETPITSTSHPVTLNAWTSQFEVLKEWMTQHHEPSDSDKHQTINAIMDKLHNEFVNHFKINPHPMNIPYETLQTLVADLQTLRRHMPLKYEKTITMLRCQVLCFEDEGYCITGLTGRLNSLLESVKGEQSMLDSVNRALSNWFQSRMGDHESSIQYEAIQTILSEFGFAKHPRHPVTQGDYLMHFSMVVREKWATCQDEIKTVILEGIKQFYMEKIDHILHDNPAEPIPIVRFFKTLSHAKLIDTIPEKRITDCMHQAGDNHFNRVALEQLVTECLLSVAQNTGLLSKPPHTST